MSAQHITSRTVRSAFIESTARVPISASVIAFDLDPTPRTINGTPTAFQEFGGITTANAHGHTVGLALDTKDTSRWGESVPVAALNAGAWSGSELNRWAFTANTATWANNGVASGIWNNTWYPSGYMAPIELSYTVSGFTGTAAGGVDNYPLRLTPDSATTVITRIASANGTYKFRGYWRHAAGSPASPSYLHLYGAATNGFTLSDITAKRIDGNHAFQTVSAARPVLQYLTDNRPGWAFKFDMIDDALILYSVTPAGAGCTLYLVGLTSVTRVDGATIGNQYTLTGYQYVRRVIALTRAPTASEDARIRNYLRELYGVL